MRQFAAVLVSSVVSVFLAMPLARAAFPDRNITIIVAFSPGGGFDTLSRAIGRSMKKFLPEGVGVIVKNITGAGGVTGTIATYRAKPDGYTVGHIFGGMLGGQVMKGPDKAGYDFGKFTWLARVGAEPFALLVRKQSRYRSVKDLQQAERITWGVEGIGAGRWFDAFIAAKEMKIPFDVVAGYRGTGDMLPGMLRGDHDVFLQPIDHPSVVPYLKTGEIRPLVTLGETRAKNAPDVPTAKELGYDLKLFVGRAIAAPPDTPADRAKVLESLFLKAMTDKDYTEFVAKSGIVLIPGSAEEATAELKGLASFYGKYKPDMLKSLRK